MTRARVSTYKYTVGHNSGLPNIQAAIDRIAEDLRASPPVEQDFTITVGRGVYPAFNIPQGALSVLHGTEKRLIIRSAGEFFPIVDGLATPKGTYIGADIQSNNPNVTIEGLRFQNFSVGIRFSTNSHKPELKRVISANNKNTNILIEQCQRPVVVNSIIVNGDYGAVIRLCKDITFLHNSVFLNGSLGSAEAGLWLQLANNYGNGLSDTGKLVFLGNIVWNTSGPALILFQEDLEDNAVVSNYNNIVRSRDYTIGIEKKKHVPNNPRERRKIASLREWRSLGIKSNPGNTLLDKDSISADPKFLATLKSKDGKAALRIDLTLFQNSPVLGLVPSFYFDATQASTWLPSFFDPNDISTDILLAKRQKDGTAAGANDKRSNAGYFGQDIFISPRDLNPDKDCKVDPYVDLIDLGLDIAFPKITPGYFYSHEREYYLYARKMCRTIGECAKTTFKLPARISSLKPIKVLVAGKTIKDPRYIDIIGDLFVLYHFDLGIQTPQEEVEIECYTQTWDNNAREFKYFPVYYRFRIQDGLTEFFLPEDYKPVGPVVITDDRVSLLDPEDMAHREFSVTWDYDEQKARIEFAQNSNLISNAQFDSIFGTGQTPLCWASQNATVHTGTFFGEYSPVMGDYACNVGTGGYIHQIVPVTSGEYSVSWHSLFTSGQSYSGVTGKTGSYLLEFYDRNYDIVGVQYTGEFVSSDTNWNRFYVTFGSQDPLTGETLTGHYPLVSLGNTPEFPEGAAYMLVRLNNESDSDMWVDAVQAEQTPRPTPYHRRFHLQELTIEYETSDEGFFIDTRQALAPVRNILNQGFLYIPEIPASIYDGPRNTTTTTLYEYRWTNGRANVMPWARLFGKDKLRNKSVFNPSPQPPNPRIQMVHQTSIPTQITISPEFPTARQGDTNGVGFQVYVSDEVSNPLAGGDCFVSISDPRGRFPGWLHTRVYGAKQQLLSVVYVKLDNTGAGQIIWVPPDQSTVAYSGPIPRPSKSSTKDRISSVELNYRISEEAFGSPIIIGPNGQRLKTSSDTPVRATYRPTFSRGISTIHLRYPPTPGSVRVFARGRWLQETLFDNPDSTQFFVDYPNSQIILRGEVTTAKVEYRPSWVFMNPANPYRLMFFHDKIFSNLTGDIHIGYDALLTLKVGVLYPTSSESLEKTFFAIAQNHLLRDSVNSLSWEF
ncbi:MAG: right-handed parallel beta-helix repeat-containing protein [Gammaproteobacteria bacterium]|nr:MAG: right-handed parallel beta-helix repeat-containing protein [Gammaproteobacteria bacterium]